MFIKTMLFCAMCARGDAKRDAGLSTPAGITRFDAIPYGPDRANTLDVYYPAGTNGKLPTIVNVHGGGYAYGSTKTYQFYCMDLALRGFAVVSFNYRLAPRYKFPTPLLDTNAVLQWVCANAHLYHLDPGNLFLIGDSAGAQIASQYAALVTAPAYATIMGIAPPPIRLAGLGLNCGMYDMERSLELADSSRFLKENYFGQDLSLWGEKLDVLAHITAAYPPTYLMSAPGDFLVGNCQPMAALLQARGVPCAYKIYGDDSTGHVFHINIRSPLARQANDDQINFLKQYIR